MITVTAGHVRGLDVKDDSPQLGVELVCGDEVEGLRLPQVLSVGEREVILAPGEVHADGRLHDLDGADVVPVEGTTILSIDKYCVILCDTESFLFFN